MSSIENPQILIAIAGAIAVLGVGVYDNRRSINKLKDWAWGPERSEHDHGHEGEIETLSEQLDRIEEMLEEERAARQEDHRSVEGQVLMNRYLTVTTTQTLIETIDSEVDDTDIDEDDIYPDWVSDDEITVDPFRRRHTDDDCS